MNWTDWEREEFEREAQQQICQNNPCDHPLCPEDSDVDPWEGDELQ